MQVMVTAPQQGRASSLYRLTQGQYDSLQQKWGTNTLLDGLNFAEEIFKELDSDQRDGALTLHEFSRILGVMGCERSHFAKLLFGALDRNDDGSIDFCEFTSWVLTMRNGTVEDKLAFGFQLIDMNRDGQISKMEIYHTLQSLFTTLSNLSLQAPNLDKFVDEMCERFELTDNNCITWDVWREKALQNISFVKSFGSLASHPPQVLTPSNGPKTFFGQKTWDFMLAVMLTMQCSLERIATVADSVPPEDTKADRFEISAGPGGVSIRAKAVRPHLFRAIRHYFHIDDTYFAESIGVRQVLGALLMGDLTTMSGLVSEGKSKSFFFTSYDGRFLVKTVKKDEAKCLESMADDYWRYLQANPDSLLTRYYGLYKINVPATTYFVVMSNLFYTDLKIDIRFDLKGSTQGRASLGEKGVSTFDSNKVIYKDLDWLYASRRLALGPSRAPQLWHQIMRDSEFLCSHGVIDYSLLVGIHTNRNPPLEAFAAWEAQNRDSLKAKHERLRTKDGCVDNTVFDMLEYRDLAWLAYCHSSGGVGEETEELTGDWRPGPRKEVGFGALKSYRITPEHRVVCGEEVIFLGIIDTLVPYGGKKQVESYAKSILYDHKKVSVTAPDLYSNRFLRFIRTEVLEGLPPESKPDRILNPANSPYSSGSVRSSSMFSPSTEGLSPSASAGLPRQRAETSPRIRINQAASSPNLRPALSSNTSTNNN